MKEYPIRIRREASYIEEVDAIVVAKSREAADRIAEGIGNGDPPNWPSIQRYNTHAREAVRHELVELTHA